MRSVNSAPAITWRCVKCYNVPSSLLQVFYCHPLTNLALYPFLCKTGHSQPAGLFSRPAGSARAVLRFVIRLQWTVPLSEALRRYTLCSKVLVLAVLAHGVTRSALPYLIMTHLVLGYKIMGNCLNCVKERRSLVTEVPVSFVRGPVFNSWPARRQLWERESLFPVTWLGQCWDSVLQRPRWMGVRP